MPPENKDNGEPASYFPARLKCVRQQRGLSQADLSLALGLNVHTVGNWEQGRSSPALSYFPRLCRILGTTSDFLLGTDGSPASELAMARRFFSLSSDKRHALSLMLDALGAKP